MLALNWLLGRSVECVGDSHGCRLSCVVYFDEGVWNENKVKSYTHQDGVRNHENDSLESTVPCLVNDKII